MNVINNIFSFIFSFSGQLIGVTWRKLFTLNNIIFSTGVILLELMECKLNIDFSGFWMIKKQKRVKTMVIEVEMYGNKWIPYVQTKIIIFPLQISLLFIKTPTTNLILLPYAPPLPVIQFLPDVSNPPLHFLPLQCRDYLLVSLLE